MKLTATDFSLLDVGTTGYTEFKLGVDLFDLFDEKPHLLGKAYGLMHSHHSMTAFFSGTDSENLWDSAKFFNFYLSLIVNKAGDFVAKVSVEGKYSAAITQHVKDSKGEFKEYKYDEPEATCVFVYDCDINWESTEASKVSKLKKPFVTGKGVLARVSPHDFTPPPFRNNSFESWAFNKEGKEQLEMFEGEEEDDLLLELGIDLSTATFNEKCRAYVEKLSYLEVGDIALGDELIRMSGIGGSLKDELDDDSESLLQVLFEPYLNLDEFVLKNQKDKFVKELKHILRGYKLPKEVFEMFDIQFANTFEILL